MNIIAKLKANVEGATGWPFMYGNEEQINRMIDNTSMPCVFAFLTNQNAIADRNGIFHEVLSIALFFVNLTEFDPDSLENEDIIDECKRTAFKWLAANQVQGDLKVTLPPNSSSRVYEEFDAIVTGYGVNVTIEETEGVGKCSV